MFNIIQESMLANFTVYDDHCNHSKGISKRLFFVMKAIMRRAYKDKLKTIFIPSDIYPLDFDYGVYQGMEIISSDLLVEDAAIYDIYKSLGGGFPTSCNRFVVGIGSSKTLLGVC